MKKKWIVILFIVLFLMVFTIFTNYVDSGRVATNHEPKYCIKIVNENGSKITYWGLGYKVVRYVGVSPEEPYESNIGAKMGNWWMEYDLPIDEEKSENPKQEIENLDDFYHTKLTKNSDIRTLGEDYHSFDAQKDGYFVIGAMVHNDNLYQEFKEDCNNQKTAFIRVAQNTIEGDLILYDVLYYEKSNQFYLVTDNTRDQFSAEKDRKIELRNFEHMAEYEFEGHLYWILYNNEINAETFYSDDIFILTTID